MRSPWTIKPNEKDLEEEEEEDEEEAGMAAMPLAAKSSFNVRRLVAMTLCLTACIFALLTAHVFFTPAPVVCPACTSTNIDADAPTTALTTISTPPVVCPTVPAATATPPAVVTPAAATTPAVPVDAWSYAGLMGEDPTSGAALRNNLISDRDAFAAWVQESQFPKDCDKRKLYVLNGGHHAGLGSQLVVYQNHFLRALRLDRTLVINYQTSYGNGVCDSSNWDCFFQPITNCKAPSKLDPADQALPQGERRVLVDPEMVWVFPDESQEVEFWNDRQAPDPLWKFFRPWPLSPASAGSLPRGNVFYFAEGLRFLMRPNKLLLDTMKEVQSEPSMAAGAIGWNAPKTHLLSVHIRHGDNDYVVHQTSEFGVRIRRQLQDYNQPVVFIGSDDNNAISEIKDLLSKRLTPPIVCHLAPEHFGVAGKANALSTLKQREGLYLIVQYFYFARAHSLIDGITSNSGRLLYQMRMWRRHEAHLVEHPMIDMDGDMWSTAGGWEVDSWKTTFTPKHGAPKVDPQPVPKRRDA